MKLTPREVETRDLHIGKILIFCEGYTEENYFKYFKDRLKSKYDDIEIQTKLAGANAQAVFNMAEKFFEDDKNKQDFSDYEKYLVFDCDAPPTILKVINDAESSDNEYKLLISCLIFEVWLLMHFEDVEGDKLSKNTTYRKMSEYLRIDKYTKHKNDAEIIPEIIYKKGNIENAISTSKKLRNSYLQCNMNIETIIEEKLPYSQVDILVSQLVNAIN
ncbi:MAG: RloB family protein [Hominimerdicola sp.]